MSLLNEGYKPTKNANYNCDTTDRVYYYESPCSSDIVLKDSKYYHICLAGHKALLFG